MRPTYSVLIALATAAALAGCGGDDSSTPDSAASNTASSSADSSPSSPSSGDQPTEVRATVVKFLEDVEAGRVDEACKVLAPEAAEAARGKTLATLKAPEGEGADQMAFVLKANKESKGCPGTLKLVAQQRADDLAALGTAAEKAKVTKGASGDSWTLDGAGWVVTRSGDALTITTAGF